MRNSASLGEGVIAVSLLFGLVGGGALIVVGDWSNIAALFGGMGIAALVAVVLLLGWRPPAGGPGGARELSPKSDGSAGTAAPGTGHAAPAPATGETTSAAPASQPVAAAASPAAAVTAPAPAPAPEPAPEPAPAPVSAEAAVKPEMLSAAREGGPDDLKQIKGVGPKLEALLHRLGVFHFDQVASWSAEEVAWVDEHLEGFKGRVSRDNWVSQAKVLAAGGATEFSQKVQKGDVY
jgi:predicted flap endonuclease-1-like 5' DNA nuclease